MGYSTEYEGSINIDPPLNDAKIKWCEEFFETRHGGNIEVDPGKPGMWCDLAVKRDGTAIAWNGSEKTYELPAWIAYLIDNVFEKSGHTLNGTLSAQGEEPSDMFLVQVKDNRVTVVELIPTMGNAVQVGGTRRIEPPK